MRGGLRKADTLANAQRQIRAKASTMANCARADATTVHVRVDAMVVRETARGVLRKEILRKENLQRENLRREIVFEDNRWKKIKM